MILQIIATIYMAVNIVGKLNRLVNLIKRNFSYTITEGILSTCILAVFWFIVLYTIWR